MLELKRGLGALLIAGVGLPVHLSRVATAATPVGDATTVVRQVSGELDGRSRMVRPGENVFHDETIKTDHESHAQLRLLDQSNLWLGAQAAIKLDRFIYDPNGRNPSVVVSALKGAVRWVSGSLPSKSYKIQTPHVALGIRGTTFDVLVGRTETVVVLVEGAVTVCPRTGARACQTLDRPGAIATGTSTGVQGPNSPRSRALDLPALYRRLGGNFLGQALPTQLGEVPGLPGVRMDAARHLSPVRMPTAPGGLGGEGNSIGGSLSIGNGGIGLGGAGANNAGAVLGPAANPASPIAPVAPAGPAPAGAIAPAVPALPSLPLPTR